MGGLWLKGYNKVLFIGLLALAFLPPLFVVPRLATGNPVVASKELIVNFLCGTLILFYCLRLVLRLEMRFAARAVQLSAAALFAVTILASLASGEIIYSLKKASGQLMLLCVFVLAQDVVRGVRDTEKVRLTLVASGVLVCVYGLMQYWKPGFLSQLYPYEYGEQARHYLLATLGNPEYVGGYVTPLALLVLPTVLLARATVSRIAGALCFCLFVVIVLLSEARGAWLGFAGGLVLLGAILRRGQQWVLMRRHIMQFAWLFMLLVALVIIFSFPNPINRRHISIIGRFKELFHAQSDSIRERVLFYSVSADMIFDRPLLGVGAGMFQVKFYEYVEKLAERDDSGAMEHMVLSLRNRATDTPHNDFLQFWVETGTIGLLAFLFFLVSYFTTIVGSIKSRDASDAYLRLQAGMAAAVLCLAINASFSFPLHLPVRACLFWVLCSVSCSLRFHEASKGERVF